MEKETLKIWRLLIPGIIILIFFIPWLTNSKEELFKIDSVFKSFKWTDTFYLGVIILLEAIYYAVNARNLVWKPYHTKIQENIKDTLLTSCTIELTTKQWYGIKKGRALMNIFYSFVDNNPSLQEKAKGVRFNGLLWSTAIDLTTISCFGGVVYWILSLFTTKSHLIYVSSFLFIAAIIALAFTKLLTYKHMDLSNQQLEMILQTNGPDIDKKVQDAIKNLSNA